MPLLCHLPQTKLPPLHPSTPIQFSPKMASNTEFLLLSSLSQRLHEVDPTNPLELRAFYDVLLSRANNLVPSVTLLTSNFTLEDVVHYFRLENKRSARNGFVKVIVPEFQLAPDDSICPAPESMAWLRTHPPPCLITCTDRYLDEGIAKSNALWGQQSDIGRRLIVNLLLTDTLWRASTMTDSKYNNPAMPLQLQAFANIAFSYPVFTPGGGKVLITGRCDMCFAYGDGKGVTPWDDTFLGVLEMKRTDELEKVFPELLAYLGVCLLPSTPRRGLTAYQECYIMPVLPLARWMQLSLVLLPMDSDTVFARLIICLWCAPPPHAAPPLTKYVFRGTALEPMISWNTTLK